jgi:hypothetical protein
VSIQLMFATGSFVRSFVRASSSFKS